MKNKSIGLNIVLSFVGFIILAAGAVIAKISRDSTGIILTLPYIMIGIGSGIFGGNLGAAFSILAARKNPQAFKQKEIEEKDERNIAIMNSAKAKAYDLMIFVYSALMMAVALLKPDMTTIILMVAAYLFVILSNVYYFNKFNKEM